MAFVKLRELDRNRILEYISKEPEYNLFIYGDIESFGIDHDPVEVFADERMVSYDTGETRWESLVLRYRNYYIVYSQKELYDVAALAEFLLQRSEVEGVSGKGSLVEPLVPYFPDSRYQPTYLSRCNELKYEIPVARLTADGYVLRRLEASDAQVVLDVLVRIDEFSSIYRGKNMIEERYVVARDLTLTGMGYGVFHNGKLVACAKTSGQNRLGAVIVGVATLPAHRRRGLASACVAEICRANFEAGRQFLSLFYDNPEAGKVYRRLGFVEMGVWGMLRFPSDGAVS